jgi:predicted transcriptional regulator of viral defense system
MPTKLDTIETLARKKGLLRDRDLRQHGLPRVYLGRMVRKGLLVRQARGVYSAPDFEPTHTHDAELACLRVPHGVLCLLSALVYHRIGTQNPAQVWLAIDGKAWHPKIDHPPLRIVRFSGLALTSNVLIERSETGLIRVFDPAKTVADCFKFRQKVGLDVALEALRDGWRMRKFTMDQLVSAAEICRVRQVIQPYLEMLT